MAWLESLAEKQGADEETLSLRPEDRTDTPPDWVQELQTRNRSADMEISETAAVEQEEVVSAEEIESETELSPEISEDVEQAESEETTVESPVAELDEEDAFAWLESLAEKQGADEGTLSVRLEDRTDAPPDWVQELQTEAEALAELSETAPVEAEDDSGPTEEIVSETEVLHWKHQKLLSRQNRKKPRQKALLVTWTKRMHSPGWNRWLPARAPRKKRCWLLQKTGWKNRPNGSTKKPVNRQKP
jgi:hypothetical protein